MRMKRQDTIVEAMSKLPSRFHACFVGGEPIDKQLQQIKELAKKLHIDDRIHFLYLRSDVPQILKTSDIVIMSSEYEGLSLSSIEGMAAFKPFISTDVDGLREITKDIGEMFELGNSDQLAAIITRFASDEKYYSEVATRCYRHALEYDINTMTKQYMSIYQQLISRK